MGRGWESSGRHDGITKTDWIMTMIIIVGRRVPARDLLVVPVDRSSSRVRRLIPHGSGSGSPGPPFPPSCPGMRGGLPGGAGRGVTPLGFRRGIGPGSAVAKHS